MPIEKFHLEVIRQLLEKYHQPIPEHTGGRKSADAETLLSLTFPDAHYPDAIPPTATKAKPFRECIV